MKKLLLFSVSICVLSQVSYAEAGNPLKGLIRALKSVGKTTSKTDAALLKAAESAKTEKITANIIKEQTPPAPAPLPVLETSVKTAASVTPLKAQALSHAEKKELIMAKSQDYLRKSAQNPNSYFTATMSAEEALDLLGRKTILIADDTDLSSLAAELRPFAKEVVYVDSVTKANEFIDSFTGHRRDLVVLADRDFSYTEPDRSGDEILAYVKATGKRARVFSITTINMNVPFTLTQLMKKGYDGINVWSGGGKSFEPLALAVAIKNSRVKLTNLRGFSRIVTKDEFAAVRFFDIERWEYESLADINKNLEALHALEKRLSDAYRNKDEHLVPYYIRLSNHIKYLSDKINKMSDRM